MKKESGFDIFSLVPKEVEFELSSHPGKKIWLNKWSLRVREWAKDKYTAAGLRVIFETHQIGEIADIAFFMLKDKEQFKTKDDFFEAILTLQDQLNVIKALLGAVGIGEPEYKKIQEAVDKTMGQSAAPEKKSQKKTAKIGSKSLTP